jgi:CheY-like chemotaxis protein
MERPFFSSQLNSSEPIASRNINVVLVDDEPSVLFALQLLLKAVGYNVLEFSCAKKALEYFDTWESETSELQEDKPERCDVVLSDLRMPEMDGFEFIRQLRRRKAELPIILMSAHASPREQELAEQLGSNAFLAKPFTPDKLDALVDMLCLKGNDTDHQKDVGNF